MNKRMPGNLLRAVLASLVILPAAHAAGKVPEIVVQSERTSWNYTCGEQPEFSVVIRNATPLLAAAELTYSYGPEMQEAVDGGTVRLHNGAAKIKVGSLSQPGFLRLRVQATGGGDTLRSLCTVAFDHERITPTVLRPDDFAQFWQKAIRENREIPLDAQFAVSADMSTDKVTVYQVNFQNYRIGSRIFGWLAVPKAAGKYPAILNIPGAGVWHYGVNAELAEKGFVVMNIFIHGIPLDMPDSLYKMLKVTSLYAYPRYGIESPDQYYYKRVVVGCVRAVDLLCTLPQCDTTRLGVTGQSQGGGLSVMTASLDKRIRAMVAFHPGLCDQTGPLFGRAGGWPHLLRGVDPKSDYARLVQHTSAYYDVVNFARDLSIPCYFTWGYNDEVCPPTSFYSAYNVIQSPKQTKVFLPLGHTTTAEQRDGADSWLSNQLINMSLSQPSPSPNTIASADGWLCP